MPVRTHARTARRSRARTGGPAGIRASATGSGPPLRSVAATRADDSPVVGQHDVRPMASAHRPAGRREQRRRPVRPLRATARRLASRETAANRQLRHLAQVGPARRCPSGDEQVRRWSWPDLQEADGLAAATFRRQSGMYTPSSSTTAIRASIGPPVSQRCRDSRWLDACSDGVPWTTASTVAPMPMNTTTSSEQEQPRRRGTARCRWPRCRMVNSLTNGPNGGEPVMARNPARKQRARERHAPQRPAARRRSTCCRRPGGCCRPTGTARPWSGRC